MTNRPAVLKVAMTGLLAGALAVLPVALEGGDDCFGCQSESAGAVGCPSGPRHYTYEQAHGNWGNNPHHYVIECYACYEAEAGHSDTCERFGAAALSIGLDRVIVASNLVDTDKVLESVLRRYSANVRVDFASAQLELDACDGSGESTIVRLSPTELIRVSRALAAVEAADA